MSPLPTSTSSASTQIREREEPAAPSFGADALGVDTRGYSWESSSGAYEDSANWSWSTPGAWC